MSNNPEVSNFVTSRDVSTSKAAVSYIVAPTLQVFIPILIMNIQMQVTSAMQMIEDQATWLTSLFEGKVGLDEEPEDIGGLSYLSQEMCFDHQNFGFLSVNDTSPSYSYCDFG